MQAQPATTSDMLTLCHSAGLSDEQIRAYVGDSSAPATAAELHLHPTNVSVFVLLTLCRGCFMISDHGAITGFRYADASQIAQWHDISKSDCQRLPVAVDAILRGKNGNV